MRITEKRKTEIFKNLMNFAYVSKNFLYLYLTKYKYIYFFKLNFIEMLFN